MGFKARAVVSQPEVCDITFSFSAAHEVVHDDVTCNLSHDVVDAILGHPIYTRPGLSGLRGYPPRFSEYPFAFQSPLGVKVRTVIYSPIF